MRDETVNLLRDVYNFVGCKHFNGICIKNIIVEISNVLRVVLEAELRFSKKDLIVNVQEKILKNGEDVFVHLLHNDSLKAIKIQVDLMIFIRRQIIHLRRLIEIR